jgi:hypothetical protein
MHGTNPKHGITKPKAHCAWMLHDDNAWLDIFLHCEDFQFHVGLTLTTSSKVWAKLKHIL